MRKQKGITLLALVITIIVLIILAGVSISALLGDDGIVGQADIAEEKTNTEGEIEQIQMAYNAELMNNKIEKLGPVTLDQLKTRLETNGAKLSKTNPVKEIAEGFQIKFESGRKYSINVANKEVSYIGGNEGTTIPAGMYSVNEEVTPAPQELFLIEQIDEKTAKITGMNNDYIEKNSETFYAIKSSVGVGDTLVIPYEVEIDGKMHTVTEVNLYVRKPEYDKTKEPGKETITRCAWSPFPSVKTIIYPNTVTSIIAPGSSYDTDNWRGWYYDNNHIGVQEIILSNKITEIGEKTFEACTRLTSITIPSSVTIIGESAFANCESLTNITIPSSVTSIGDKAFYDCNNLTSVTIGNGVTSIGDKAFYDCNNLETVKFETEILPTLGSSCFYGNQITYLFKNVNVLKSFWSEADVSKMQGEYYYYNYYDYYQT